MLPHEVISKFYSSQEYPSIAPHPSDSSSAGFQSQELSSQTSASTSETSVGDPPRNCRKGSTAGPTATSSNTQTPGTDLSLSGKADNTEVLWAAKKPITEPIGSQERRVGLMRSQSHTVPSRRGSNYLANRRRASFVIHDDYRAAAASECSAKDKQANSAYAKSSPSLTGRRTTSHVRLSLSVEGKAEVSTRVEDSPPPSQSNHVTVNQTQSRPYLGLQRSYSALQPSISKIITDVPALLNVKRPITGRSRDARAWEFYCDSDARNALTKQAEREESGSAAAAISMIKSRNDINKSSPANPHKREAHAQKPDNTKRVKSGDQKRSRIPLERALSSIARLQTTNSNVQRQASVKSVDEKKLSKAASQDQDIPYGDGDSDKENWVPGTQSSDLRRRRPIRNQEAVRILEESLRVPSQSFSLDALLAHGSSRSPKYNRKSDSSQDKENFGPILDHEIVEFMGAGAPREVEDLDCVQHLLSLSQAAWQ